MSRWNSDVLAGLFTVFVTVVFFNEGRSNAFVANITPLTMEAFLFLMGIVLIVRGIVSPKNQYVHSDKFIYKRILIMIAFTLLYVAGVNIIGFYTSTIIFLVGASFYFNEKGYNLRAFLWSCIFCATLTLSLYIIFWICLKVPLPGGLLW
jgi:hypothetical protein